MIYVILNKSILSFVLPNTLKTLKSVVIKQIYGKLIFRIFEILPSKTNSVHLDHPNYKNRIQQYVSSSVSFASAM